jgi:hypothetical protein
MGPFFEGSMNLNDVYDYPTKHFDFHGRQLDLNRPSGAGR